MQICNLKRIQGLDLNLHAHIITLFVCRNIFHKERMEKLTGKLGYNSGPLTSELDFRGALALSSFPESQLSM
jgi:hypothetical protein